MAEHLLDVFFPVVGGAGKIEHLLHGYDEHLLLNGGEPSDVPLFPYFFQEVVDFVTPVAEVEQFGTKLIHAAIPAQAFPLFLHSALRP